jgi:hypothetical protein
VEKTKTSRESRYKAYYLAVAPSLVIMTSGLAPPYIKTLTLNHNKIYHSEFQTDATSFMVHDDGGGATVARTSFH